MPFLKGCSMDVDVQSYNIGHLGIAVAGIFDDLKIAEVIDRLYQSRVPGIYHIR
jgi:hypothetical protein